MDPSEPHALAAPVFLTPTYGDWTHKDALTRAAQSRSVVDGAPPIRARVLFLLDVGRHREALAQARRLRKLRPLAPFVMDNLLSALIASGELEEARAVARQAGELWPRHPDLWRQRFQLALRLGEIDVARSMVASRDSWPAGSRESDMARLGQLAEAVASEDPDAAEAVLAAYRAGVGEGQLYLEQAVWAAAALGRPDAAFAFADQLYDKARPQIVRVRNTDSVRYVIAGDRPTTVWFGAFADRLWSDPRFPALMERIGLAGYWRTSTGPDLCRRPAMKAACAAYRL